MENNCNGIKGLDQIDAITPRVKRCMFPHLNQLHSGAIELQLASSVGKDCSPRQGADSPMGSTLPGGAFIQV